MMGGMPDPHGSLRLADGVVYEVVDGEAVVLHLPSGTYLRLNRTATKAWEALVGGAGLEGAKESILAGFQADPAVVASDLENLADDLVRRGLMVREDDEQR
jgi:hypothetical protein